MSDIFRFLNETPIQTILVITGLVFLFLAVVKRLPWSIEVPTERQKWAVIIGIILLLSGLGLYFLGPQLSKSAGEYQRVKDLQNKIQSLQNKIGKQATRIKSLEEDNNRLRNLTGGSHEKITSTARAAAINGLTIKIFHTTNRADDAFTMKTKLEAAGAKEVIAEKKSITWDGKANVVYYRSGEYLEAALWIQAKFGEFGLKVVEEHIARTYHGGEIIFFIE